MKLPISDGKELHARFEHRQTCAHNKITTVRISSDNQIIAEGRAFCNPSDQFNKAKGRKLALARAIESLPRAERGQIWAAYFAATGGVK